MGAYLVDINTLDSYNTFVKPEATDFNQGEVHLEFTYLNTKILLDDCRT